MEDLSDYDRVVALAADQAVCALIVEDNQSSIEVLQETLTEIGVECQAVVSGWDAIDRALAWKPDVIFMDYRMPGLNGLDAAKMIHKNLGAETTKIIMVTASGYRHEQEYFLKEGAQGVIAKPFLRAEVFKALHDILGVDFVYRMKTDFQEEPVEAKGGGAPVTLPEQLFVNLKQSARLGLMSQFEETLRELESMGPDEANLARRLRRLADNFDKQGILKALEASAPQPLP